MNPPNPQPQDVPAGETPGSTEHRPGASAGAAGNPATDSHEATLYRMVMPKHICPFGLKSLDLLKRRGFEVEDRWITTHEEQENIKQRFGVKTTPQTFIGGVRIGGHDDLRMHFGLRVRDPEATSYQPVIAVFAVAALLAIAVAAAGSLQASVPATLHRFVALSMCLLAMLKLQDVETFSNMFLGYDLLGRRIVRYAYVYPFAELAAGLLMLAGWLPALSALLAAFIGSVGAASVIKAVYIEKRELKCACVGGGSKVPLGFVSLTENLMMVAMAVWTAIRML